MSKLLELHEAWKTVDFAAHAVPLSQTTERYAAFALSYEAQAAFYAEKAATFAAEDEVAATYYTDEAATLLELAAQSRAKAA